MVDSRHHIKPTYGYITSLRKVPYNPPKILIGNLLLI